jgi:hypothetical protein
MPPEVRNLLDSLREDLTPSEYVRRLVESDAARRALNSPAFALAEIARAQAELPLSWLREDLSDPLDEVHHLPEAEGLVGAAVDATDLNLSKLKPPIS